MRDRHMTTGKTALTHSVTQIEATLVLRYALHKVQAGLAWVECNNSMKNRNNKLHIRMTIK